MKNLNYGMTLLVVVLFSFNCHTSAQGNVKSTEPTTIIAGKPKLIKTHVSNEFQNLTCGLQDKNGNLWFGTSGEGVYKYDGKLFFQFTKLEGLISNSVTAILEDKAGIIWLGTSNGICKYDGKNFVSVPIPNSIRPATTTNGNYAAWSTDSTVWSMMQDKNGTIWFGTGEGVYCFNGRGFSRFLAYDGVINKENLHLKLVSDIHEDKNGIIWFASGMPPGYEGLCRFDGREIVRFRPQNEGWFRNIVESKNGDLLLATRHYGVWSYDGKTFADCAQPKDLVKESLNYILEDKTGKLWLASDYGKVLGDTLGGMWHCNVAIDSSAEKTFTKVFNKEVFFMLEDNSGNIWFGTRGVGLYRYNGKTVNKFSE